MYNLATYRTWELVKDAAVRSRPTKMSISTSTGSGGDSYVGLQAITPFSLKKRANLGSWPHKCGYPCFRKEK
jgi:hypothetical protein